MNEQPTPDVLTLTYRHPHTGEVATWTLQPPCSPALMHSIESAFARAGYERVEEE